MTGLLVYGLLGIGYSALAFGWFLIAFWQVSLALLILTPLSLYLVYRKFAPTLDLALALAVIAAAIGLARQMPLPYALSGVVCLLAAWDLDRFNLRLAFAAPEGEPASLQRRHLLQLGVVLLIGVGLSLAVLNLRLKFNFELAIGLVLLVFASLAALINWLRKIER
jgi:hypothetical protein